MIIIYNLAREAIVTCLSNFFWDIRQYKAISMTWASSGYPLPISVLITSARSLFFSA